MKFKVNREFKDKKNDLIVRKIGDIIDITEKRAKEIIKALGEGSLEKIKEKKSSKEKGEE